MKKIIIGALAIAGIICFSSLARAGLNDGLVVYYPFSGNANDESGNLNHGIVNGATLTTDRKNNQNSAYEFNGTSDWIKVDQDFLLADYSVCAWGLTNDENKKQYLVANGESFDTDKFAFSLSLNENKVGTNNANFFSAWYETQIDFDVMLNGGGLEKDQWFFACVEKTNLSFKLFVNGVVLDEISNPEKQADIYNHFLSIGVRTNSGDIFQDYFHGKIDDVRIYNRALTETEIKELYNEGSATKFVGGSVTGISNGISVTCKNLSTGVSVKIKLNDDTEWNCEESGFVVNQGDVIVQTIKGKTEAIPLEKIYEENPLLGSLSNTRLEEYRWYPFTDAVKYKINIVKDGWDYIYTKTMDASMACESDLCKISPNNFYLPNAGEMTWRVIAMDSNGKNIAQSDRITFYVNNDPLFQPLPNNAQGQMKGRVMGHCLFGGACARSSKTKSHNATDYMVSAGTAVYAICDGKVKEARTSGKVWSRFTNIDHSGNCGFNKLFAYYGHIDPIVKKGDSIKYGQKIGEVAIWKDNSHLHLAISQDKYHTNEWGYVDVGVDTNNSCRKIPVNKRIKLLLDKGWADVAKVGYMGGWNLFNLKGGKSGGDCNVKKRLEYKPYPYGNSLPYSPWSK